MLLLGRRKKKKYLLEKKKVLQGLKKVKLASDVHDVDVFVLRGCQEVSPSAPVYG